MANSPKTIRVTNDALAKEIEDSGKALIDLGMRLRRGFEVPIEYKASPATAPEPAAPSVIYCGATNPENETYISCMLDSGHDGKHWSTSGCPGGAVEWSEHAALSDREPRPGDGPDYLANHAAWERRQPVALSDEPTDAGVRLKLEARAWGEQYHAGMSQKEAAAFKRGHAAGWLAGRKHERGER